MVRNAIEIKQKVWYIKLFDSMYQKAYFFKVFFSLFAYIKEKGGFEIFLISHGLVLPNF